MRSEYFLEMNQDKAKEEIVMGFLLSHADTVRLTAVTWREGWLWKKKGAVKDDIIFQKVLQNFKPAFLRKETNNRRFNLSQGNKKFTHYYFALTPKIKKLLRQTGSFWNVFPPSTTTAFYGFEDITFFKRKILLATTITHEEYVTLHLTPVQKKTLEKKGLSL